MAVIYLSSAWVAGILLGLSFDLPLALIFTGLAPLPLLFYNRYRKHIVLASLCLFVFLGGAFYSPSSLPADNKNHLSFYNGKGVATIKGMVSDDPDVRDKNTQIRLSASEIKLNQERHQIQGTALLFVPSYSTYSYGDVISVTGELKTPPIFMKEESVEVEFDYKSYLEHQGIYSTMLYPKIEVVETGQGFKPLEWIYSLRNSLSRTLAEALPEPQASLAQGIILGIRGNIPSELREDFSITGTAHILAISGQNLTIVAGMLLSLGIWLFGRRHYLYIWLSLSIIWLYVLLTGMQPPVVRGAIMASIFLFAELLGRQRSAFTALALAAAIMVGLEPQVLLSASFQLSFLATAGLIFIFPRLRDLGRRVVNTILSQHPKVAPIANLVADGFSVTLAAVIAVWPVVAYYFGIVSLVGPLATLLALPALPGIIIVGALTGGLGIIAPLAAQVTGWLAWLFLSYFLLVVNSFATLPMSSIEVGSISATLLWAYYPVLALILGLTSNRWLSRLKARSMTVVKPIIASSGGFFSRLSKKWLITTLVVVAILASLAVVATPDDRLYISFLNVGQGDAILIQRGSYQVLVDGGPSRQAITLELGKRMPFWDRTVELVVLTHPHSDHITGLVEVMSRYRVEQVLYPVLDYESSIYDEWLRLIDEKDIKATLAQAGHQIDLGGVVIAVLNPQDQPLSGTESDIDNNSLVLYVSLGRISFLLVADLMWSGEFELLSQRAIPQSTVLKVAHHGSATSTTAEFLAVASPQLAVISVGANNEFGHPHPDVIARLEVELGSDNIYRTDLHGTIEFITNGERLWVRVKG